MSESPFTDEEYVSIVNGAFEAAGMWYREVLVATATALHDVALPTDLAPDFVAALRRQGWEINRAEINKVPER